MVRSRLGIAEGNVKNMSGLKKLAALIGAGALVFAMAGTALAVADYATVSGHSVSTSDNNNGRLLGR